MRQDFNLPQLGNCVKLPESEKDMFFDEDSTDAAREMCATCPIKRDCLRLALDNSEEFGVWGGSDPDARRLALSVDMNNKAYTRAPWPVCPNCDAPCEELSGRKRDIPGGGRWPFEYVVDCNKCGFDYTSRTGFRGVQAYWKLRDRQYQAAERDAQVAARYGWEVQDPHPIPAHGINTLAI